MSSPFYPERTIVPGLLLAKGESLPASPVVKRQFKPKNPGRRNSPQSTQAAVVDSPMGGGSTETILPAARPYTSDTSKFLLEHLDNNRKPLVHYSESQFGRSMLALETTRPTVPEGAEFPRGSVVGERTSPAAEVSPTAVSEAARCPPSIPPPSQLRSAVIPRILLTGGASVPTSLPKIREIKQSRSRRLNLPQAPEAAIADSPMEEPAASIPTPKTSKFLKQCPNNNGQPLVLNREFRFEIDMLASGTTGPIISKETKPDTREVVDESDIASPAAVAAEKEFTTAALETVKVTPTDPVIELKPTKKVEKRPMKEESVEVDSRNLAITATPSEIAVRPIIKPKGHTKKSTSLPIFIKALESLRTSVKEAVIILSSRGDGVVTDMALVNYLGPSVIGPAFVAGISFETITIAMMKELKELEDSRMKMRISMSTPVHEDKEQEEERQKVPELTEETMDDMEGVVSHTEEATTSVTTQTPATSIEITTDRMEICSPIKNRAAVTSGPIFGVEDASSEDMECDVEILAGGPSTFNLDSSVDDITIEGSTSEYADVPMVICQQDTLRPSKLPSVTLSPINGADSFGNVKRETGDPNSTLLNLGILDYCDIATDATEIDNTPPHGNGTDDMDYKEGEDLVTGHCEVVVEAFRGYCGGVGGESGSEFFTPPEEQNGEGFQDACTDDRDSVYDAGLPAICEDLAQTEPDSVPSIENPLDIDYGHSIREIYENREHDIVVPGFRVEPEEQRSTVEGVEVPLVAESSELDQETVQQLLLFEKGSTNLSSAQTIIRSKWVDGIYVGHSEVKEEESGNELNEGEGEPHSGEVPARDSVRYSPNASGVLVDDKKADGEPQNELLEDLLSMEDQNDAEVTNPLPTCENYTKGGTLTASHSPTKGDLIRQDSIQTETGERASKTEREVISETMNTGKTYREIRLQNKALDKSKNLEREYEQRQLPEACARYKAGNGWERSDRQTTTNCSINDSNYESFGYAIVPAEETVEDAKKKAENLRAMEPFFKEFGKNTKEWNWPVSATKGVKKALTVNPQATKTPKDVMTTADADKLESRGSITHAPDTTVTLIHAVPQPRQHFLLPFLLVALILSITFMTSILFASRMVANNFLTIADLLKQTIGVAVGNHLGISISVVCILLLGLFWMGLQWKYGQALETIHPNLGNLGIPREAIYGGILKAIVTVKVAIISGGGSWTGAAGWLLEVLVVCIALSSALRIKALELKKLREKEGGKKVAGLDLHITGYTKEPYIRIDQVNNTIGMTVENWYGEPGGLRVGGNTLLDWKTNLEVMEVLDWAQTLAPVVEICGRYELGLGIGAPALNTAVGAGHGTSVGIGAKGLFLLSTFLWRRGRRAR